MGIGMIVILKDGFGDAGDVPHMEEQKKKGMDGKGPMELRGGNEDMTQTPPDVLELLQTHLGFIFPKVFPCLLVIYLVSYFLGENIPPGEYSLQLTLQFD
jgi:hypothetical protein